MLRIIHFADLHLGIRPYGMPERQDDFLVATAYVFDRAKALKADVIHMGGDIFHSLHPSAGIVLFLQSLIQDAQRSGIRVIGVDGNHDNVESAWLQILGAEPLAPAGRQIKTTTIKGVTFAGINGGRVANIRADLDRLATESFGKIDVLSMHLPLAEMAGFEGVDMSCREIADKVKPFGVKVVLLGDIHDYKETVIGGIRFIYSGSVEMTASNENPDKTFSIVDIDGDNVKTSAERIPVRAMVHCHVGKDEDVDGLLAEIAKATVDPRRAPLALITYDSAVPGLRQKAEMVLRDKALFRILPLAAAQTADIFGQIANKTQQYERKGAMRNLRELVASKFGADGPELPLVLACIERPTEAKELALQFARSRGLDIR